MRIMDLDDLHIFRSVVREGGITRAADLLHRVPSNVTTRIKQFEERLGVSLFRRRAARSCSRTRGAPCWDMRSACCRWRTSPNRRC